MKRRLLDVVGIAVFVLLAAAVLYGWFALRRTVNWKLYYEDRVAAAVAAKTAGLEARVAALEARLNGDSPEVFRDQARDRSPPEVLDLQ